MMNQSGLLDPSEMSVIIRLQNLPWAANAADIRAYFAGLSIPEGGVHIVGGERGDAFIAFSTDEDARQAMLLDGGKLKEVKIKLLLSSRTEMLRVIEQARQQTMSILGTSVPAAAPVVPAAVVPAAAVPVASAPPAVPPAAPAPLYTTPQPQQQAVAQLQPGVKAEEKEDEDSRTKDGGRDRYRSSSRERRRSRDRDSSREKSRGRHRDSRRRRDRSRSRDRHRRRSRSRDRRRSREKDSKDRPRNKRRESKETEVMETKESPKTEEPVVQEQVPTAAPKVPVLPDPPAVPPVLMAVPNGKAGPPAPDPAIMNIAAQNVPQVPAQVPYHPQMGPMPPQAFMPMRPPNPMMMNPMQMGVPRPMMNPMEMGMPGYPQMGMPGMPMFPGPHVNDNMWRPPMMAQPVPDESDTCVEVRGLPFTVSYSEIKKFFFRLSIPPDGIKMINDNRGKRTGMAYIRFNNPMHKKTALELDGHKVRNNVVEVLHLKESVFRAAEDNFTPENMEHYHDNRESAHREGWQRGRERMERDFRGNEPRDGGRQFRNGDPRERIRQDPRMHMEEQPREKREPRMMEGPRERRDPRMIEEPRERRDPRMAEDPRERRESPRMNEDLRSRNGPRVNPEQPPEEPPRKLVTDCVLLQNLPLNCNENDIVDFFEELEIVPANIFLVLDNLGQPLGDAFCLFKNPEEAERATAKDTGRMGRSNVLVRLIPKEEMDRAMEMSHNKMIRPAPPALLGPRPPPSLLATPIGPPGQFPGGFRGESGADRFEQRRQSRWDAEEEMGGGPPGPGRFRGGGPPERGGFMPGRGERGGGHPMRGRGGGRGGSEPYPPRRGPGGPPMAPHRPQEEPAPSPNVIETFGKPGCVVALENLHFRADIDDIINFFKDFEVEHENVIRRFDEDGRPTGDARVALNSPADAERAVKLLNYKILRGRTVQVSLL